MADRDVERETSERLFVEMDPRVAVAIGLDGGARSHADGRMVDVGAAVTSGRAARRSRSQATDRMRARLRRPG